ncbi:FAD/NAD(P)-binding domain-containing protein, partial [Rhizopogon vinicolor AM-OR11-026]
GGGQNGLMCAARFGKLGIRSLVIEKNARVGDTWRQRCLRQFKGIEYLSNSRTNFPKYIPKGKFAYFLESYAINQELCIWLSSTVAPNPVYNSFSARWTVEVERANCKVILHPKHLVLAIGNGRPRILTWNGIDDFQGTLYHSNFHRDADKFRGKRVVIVGTGNAGGDIGEDFVAHGAAEVTIVQRSTTCHMSSAAAKKSFYNLTFSDKISIDELDFRHNSAPLAFSLQLMKSGGTQYLKMLDKELHEGLRKAGFNLTWELSPDSGEVEALGFLLARTGSGTSAIGFFLRWITFRMSCSTRYWLIVEGRIKVKQGQDISHFDQEGIVFKDGSKLSADVIVLAYGLTSSSFTFLT